MQKQDTFRVKASGLTSKQHQVAGGKERMPAGAPESATATVMVASSAYGLLY